MPRAFHNGWARFRSGAGPAYIVLSFLAVAACPLTMKIHVRSVAASLSDILVALSFVFFACAEYKTCTRGFLRSLAPPAVFATIVCVGAAYAVDKRDALKEAIQVGAYCIGGCAVYTYSAQHRAWKQAIAWSPLWTFGIVVGVGARTLIRGDWKSIAENPDRWESAAAVVLIAFLPYAVATAKTVSVWGRGALAAILVLATLVVCDAGTQALIEPERYREGFAALSAIGDFPLFGVGPGNYQLRIGEFYQGMPKENLIDPGTRIGLAVLIASHGLFGFSALLFWLGYLWQKADASARIALAIWIFFSLATTIASSEMLLPLAVLHGLIDAPRGSNRD